MEKSGDYNVADFDHIEHDAYDNNAMLVEQYSTSWDGNDLMNYCQNGNQLMVKLRKSGIYNSMPHSGIGYVLFFADQYVKQNKTMDAIVITALPILKIKYKP